MSGLDLFESDDGGTVFRDVTLLALTGFIAIVLMLLPHLNPPGSARAGMDPPGNIVVEMRWPDDVDADIDLWVRAPSGRAVGYSNKSGSVFNLLRDDLGMRADATALNYEVAYSRGIPEGEYIVNIHLYRNRSSVSPIPVTIVASRKRDGRESARQIVTTKLNLARDGQELTAFRFRMDGNGNLVADSVHDLPIALRTTRK